VISINEKEGSVIFKVRVQPRASRTEVAGEHGDALKLRLAAPPVDGKANQACRRFLADLLDVPMAAVEIVGGESSRDKRILVRGVTTEHVRSRLSAS
jgi:uncharacterized protein (TIGR00251 family)